MFNLAVDKKLNSSICYVFQEAGIEIATLVTDRHPQISAVMRKQFSNIKHEFDIWHLAKSLTKKVKIASQKKNCQDLRLWTKAISNHLWWSAETCGGDALNLKVLVAEKYFC